MLIDSRGVDVDDVGTLEVSEDMTEHQRCGRDDSM